MQNAPKFVQLSKIFPRFAIKNDKLFKKLIQFFHSLDKGGVSLIVANDSNSLPVKRIIYSSTGPVHGDFDDIRRYTKAGIAAGEKLVFFLIKIEIIKTSKKIENDEKVGDSDSGHASWFALESKPYIQSLNLFEMCRLIMNLGSVV
jgi:hypothetical protein